MDHSTHTDSVVDAAALLDNTDDLLADLDMSPVDDLDSEVVESISELTASDEDAIEIAAETADAYAAQETTETGVEEPETDEEGGIEAAKPKRVKKAAAVKTPKDLESIADDVFDLGNGLDKAAVIALRPTQKKIGEKFDNLFQKVSIGAAPSIYIMACLDVLNSNGEATATDMIAALKASNSRSGTPYNQGTAASQVGQMMNLFNVVGIAKRDGQKLVLDRASPLTVKLLAIAA